MLDPKLPEINTETDVLNYLMVQQKRQINNYNVSINRYLERKVYGAHKKERVN